MVASGYYHPPALRELKHEHIRIAVPRETSPHTAMEVRIPRTKLVRLLSNHENDDRRWRSWKVRWRVLKTF